MFIIINGIFCIALMVFLSRSSNKPARIDGTSGNIILYCGARYIVFAFIGFLCAFDILYIFHPILGEITLNSIIIFLPVGACIYGGLKMFLMARRYEIELTHDAIIEKQIIRKPVKIEWEKVKKVLNINRGVEIYSIEGTKIRIPQTMDGYLTLLKVIEEKHPR